MVEVFSKDVKKKMRVDKRHAKHEDDVKMLASLKTPTQIKPFSFGYECMEMQEPYSATPYKIELEIPAGATLARAKEMIYCKMHAEMIRVDQSVDSKQQHKLLAKTTCEFFIKKSV